MANIPVFDREQQNSDIKGIKETELADGKWPEILRFC
jgi:hypothetical protein